MILKPRSLAAVILFGLSSILNADTEINWEGRSPLQLALIADNEELGIRLIREGADVKARDFWERPPCTMRSPMART